MFSFLPLLPLAALCIGLSIGRWIAYCEFGGYQKGYQCKHCGHAGPLPWVHDLAPCKKCGEKKYRALIARFHFFSGFTEKSSQEQP